MATLAEDFAYYLVNPTSPWFAEGEKVFKFWGIEGVLEMLTNADPSLINHPDIVNLGAQRFNAAAIWGLLNNQTAFGVSFKEYTNVDVCEPCRKLYVAQKLT